MFAGRLKCDMRGKESRVCACACVCAHVGDSRSERSGLGLRQFLNIQPSSLCPSSDKNSPVSVAECLELCCFDGVVNHGD